MLMIKDVIANVTKALITGKTILNESKLETVQNSTWLSMIWNNSVYSIPCAYITQRLLCILHKDYYVYMQINLYSFVNSALSL